MQNFSISCTKISLFLNSIPANFLENPCKSLNTCLSSTTLLLNPLSELRHHDSVPHLRLISRVLQKDLCPAFPSSWKLPEDGGDSVDSVFTIATSWAQSRGQKMFLLTIMIASFEPFHLSCPYTILPTWMMNMKKFMEKGQSCGPEN